MLTLTYLKIYFFISMDTHTVLCGFLWQLKGLPNFVHKCARLCDVFVPKSYQISSPLKLSCPVSHSKPYERPAEGSSILEPSSGWNNHANAIPNVPATPAHWRARLRQTLPRISGLRPSGRIAVAEPFSSSHKGAPQAGQPRGACPASASRRENDCGTMAGTASLGQLCHINCQQ